VRSVTSACAAPSSKAPRRGVLAQRILLEINPNVQLDLGQVQELGRRQYRGDVNCPAVDDKGADLTDGLSTA
jgi:hypothetical protein